METTRINDMLTTLNCTGNQTKGTLFYFHGGGFVASSETDLPSFQLEALVRLYDVVLVDYPLSPEVPLMTILRKTTIAIEQALELDSQTNFNKETIVFYGRSAGAYLAAYVCSQFIKHNKKVPDKLILLYGYAHFNDEAFRTPSKYYKDRVNLTPNQEKEILSLKKSASSRFSRTLIYMQARKAGRWFDYLSISNEMLEELDVRKYVDRFPATLLAYSKHDPDVHPSHSQELAQMIPNIELFISESNDHAFDQIRNAETKIFLTKLIDFIR